MPEVISTPAGRRPLQAMCDLLAASSTVREWLGVSTRAEAAARIHKEQAAATDTRPLIVVRNEGSARLGAAGGSRLYTFPSGTFSVILERDAASADLNAQGDLSAPGTFVAALQDEADDVMAGVAALAGSPGYLFVRDMHMDEGPATSSEDEGAPYGQAVIVVDWGLLS